MSWANVVGHDPHVELFRRVAASQRLAHSYLFLGPEGIGKRTFATELAKALNCEGPDGAEAFQACDTCPSCKQIAAGTHPDVETLGLPAEKNEFPIEDIRGLIGRIHLKPARARRRVVIVDDAGALSEAACNAFLKTLEEPPPHSLLLLIGEQAEHFLPTILSRCQRVRFQPLHSSELAQLILANDLAATPLEAENLATEAEGSLGLARQLADPAVREFRERWLQGFGSVRLDAVAQAQALTKFVEDAGSISAAKRTRGTLAVRFLVEVLAAAQALAAGSPGGRATPLAEFFATTLGPRKLVALLDRVLEAEQQIARYLQLELVLQALADAIAEPLLAPAATASAAGRV